MSNDLIDRIRAHVDSTADSPRFQVASHGALERAQSQLGFCLPALLKRCYLEIGNGGFGPALGVTGVEDGHESSWGDLVATYQFLDRGWKNEGLTWPPGLLPFCEYGCAIFWCVKCDSTNKICTLDEGDVWPQDYSLDAFFEMWLKGVDIYTSDPTIEIVESKFKNPFTKREETMRLHRRRRR